jgi:hypothetical protein
VNCPFYGRALFVSQTPRGSDPPFVLFDQHGNQCGLVVTSYAPCRMEIEHQEPDWKSCFLVRIVRCEEVV